MTGVNPNKRPAPVDLAQQIEEARKRADAVRARIAASAGQNGALPTGNGYPPPPPALTHAPNGTSTNGASTAASSVAARLAEIKARVAASQSLAAKPAQSSTPPPPRQQPPPLPPPSREPPIANEFSRLDVGSGGRGGLNVGIHPALRGDYQEKKEQKGPRKKEDERKAPENVNPYLSDPAPSRSRRGGLKFTHNLHERPAMVAANEMRRKANLEAMKKRIQEQTSKAGLDDTTETTAFEVPMPPDVEFWDEGLQSGIENSELITNLVVHPILIEPPQEKFVSSKPVELMLTDKERKKLRRIRRLEVHKEEQAKIRLGLVPTPAPKIKHSNVMRVYGEMAVQDPTAVEAMVNKQVADRLNNHLQANADRQLTKEEKLEKLKLKAAENAKAGLNLMVFKVSLTKDQLLGKHRFYIDCNAKDWHDLTGVCIISQPFSLIIVEAGEKASRAYKKLLLNRVKWKGILEGGGEVQDPEKWKGVEDDTCVLLHQGQIRDRKFKKWGGLRDTETETQAKEALARAKLDNFWVQAKALEGVKE